MGNSYFYYDESIEYPRTAPYYPDTRFPEYPYIDCGQEEMSNTVYSAVRSLFLNMGLDKKNVGTRKWNPLSKYIKEGQTVLLKPNLVSHINPAEEDKTRGMDCLITHPSLVRVLFDYVYIALNGKGKIIIADAPIQNCDFERLLDETGYGALFNYVKSKKTEDLDVITSDLRAITYTRDGRDIIQRERMELDFDGVMVNLGKDSKFFGDVNRKKVRITNYDGKDTVSSHSGMKNEYMLSAAVLEADVVISLPKPKTHRLAGYTAALKNMIGVNAHKEYLPHHKIGAVKYGGDEFTGKHGVLKWINSVSNDLRNHAVKNRQKYLVVFYNEIGRRTGRLLDCYEKDRYKFGMWYGNDTIWRTILDVNYAVMYSDKKGNIRQTPQRSVISVGDMIVCGEGEGPLRPSYKRIGGLLFSDNLVEFDRFVVGIMGYDWKKIPVIYNAMKDEKFNVASKNIVIDSNDKRFAGNIDDISISFDFIPSSGWRGYL